MRIFGMLVLAAVTLSACGRGTAMDEDGAGRTGAAGAEQALGPAGAVEEAPVCDSELFGDENLTPEQLRIIRGRGTEAPFTGAYLHEKRPGVYACAACGHELFDSATKFESGSGWPSFYAPIEEKAVGEREDRSHGMVRTEIVCPKCDAHLGHVFPDGPKPTGLRYCVNSASLTLRPRDSDSEPDSD